VAPASDPSAPGTHRARLATLALDAALAVDGIVAADAGPRGMHVTAMEGRVLRGVRVAAEPGGRYSVDLGLQALLEPLEPLAERVRGSVRRSAESDGTADRLGAVTVTFHDVLDADEAAALVLGAALRATPPVTR